MSNTNQSHAALCAEIADLRAAVRAQEVARAEAIRQLEQAQGQWSVDASVIAYLRATGSDDVAVACANALNRIGLRNA